MIILGINYFFHDTSACIVKDGELLFAIEEERLSRQKHTWDFPSRAIARCFAETGIQPQHIDHIAVSIRPTKDWQRKVWYAIQLGRKALPFIKHEFWHAFNKQRSFQRWLLQTFGTRPPQVHMVDHHLAHILGSYYVSPYQDAALLSMDGSGEWSTTWLGSIIDGKVHCISESFFPHSLGSFYEAATEFCGFKPNYDEGKTMGLAPFGTPESFYPSMRNLVHITNTGEVRIDLHYFAYQNAGLTRVGEKYLATFGKPRTGKLIEQHHEDVAAAAQETLEEAVLHMCRILEKTAQTEYLVISGGVALNSVMNGRILRETRFKDLYVMPAAGDNGTSIGAAFYVFNQLLGNKQRYLHNNPYLGTEYSNEDIEKILIECKLPYSRSQDICNETASLLHQNKIVGWFQGKMEIGPRALGNRSILADPTNPGMKDKINAEVKHREAYRPFAPSAIVEESKTYFDIEVETPFMLKVCQVRKQYQARLPAITHVDGSARLQTVNREINPRYHRLISEFGKLSGIPVVLNTSFNIMGEPIVESPIQAIRCFYSTGLDVLAIGDFIVTK